MRIGAFFSSCCKSQGESVNEHPYYVNETPEQRKATIKAFQELEKSLKPTFYETVTSNAEVIAKVKEIYAWAIREKKEVTVRFLPHVVSTDAFLTVSIKPQGSTQVEKIKILFPKSIERNKPFWRERHEGNFLQGETVYDVSIFLKEQNKSDCEQLSLAIGEIFPTFTTSIKYI